MRVNCGQAIVFLLAQKGITLFRLGVSDLSHEARRNVTCFQWFRVLFNCRFYYPVYTVLFLDYGLSLREFAILNAAWALAIVFLEVPSGALADQLGRRKLVIGAAILMIVELIVLAAAPVNGGLVLFTLFLINRVVSGAAEAAASGADEALVYDSLPEAERATLWERISARLMWIHSVVFIFVTIIGAHVYDPDFMNRALATVGFDNANLTKSSTVRFPILLNILTAIGALIVAIRFRESDHGRSEHSNPVRESFRNTIKTGKWITRTPVVLMLIVLGMFFDSFIRLYYTVSSQFLRLLEIPEKDYGFVGAAGSLIGIAAAFVVVRMVRAWSPNRNFAALSGLVFVGLAGLAFAQPQFGYFGVLLVVPLWLGMRMLQYFLSQYLNAAVDSSHRATVLSFRGLSMNLAYGAIMLAFGIQTAVLRGQLPDTPNLSDAEAKAIVFSDSRIWWLISYSLVGIFVIFLLRRACRCKISNLLASCDTRSKRSN